MRDWRGALSRRQPEPASACRLPAPSADPAAYARRLAIVVPYRDRTEHLARSPPHMVTYFQRQARLRDRLFHPYRRAAGPPAVQPRRAEERRVQDRCDAAEYSASTASIICRCGHYSYVERPTRLVWHGLDPTHHRAFMAAVVALNRGDSSGINGYSNDYRGWGYETTTCARAARLPASSSRFATGRIRTFHTFTEGFNADATPTTEAQANARTFAAKVVAGAAVFRRRGSLDAGVHRRGIRHLAPEVGRRRTSTQKTRCADAAARGQRFARATT